MSNSLWPHELQRSLTILCPLLPSKVCSNLSPLSQWCYPPILSSVIPFSFAFNLSQHQGLFQWVSSLHQVAKILVLQLHNHSFQWIFRLISFRIDWFDLAVQQTLQESSLTLQFKSINYLALSLLYGPTFTSVHDYWKRHSFD